jgi:hypothetical protein
MTTLAAAAATSSVIPAWNWYGFSASYALMESSDLIGGWLLVGLVLGGLRKKLVAH